MAKAESTSFTCLFQGCEKKFRRRDKLEIHMRCHTGEQPFVCDVPGCQKAYGRAQHLVRHTQRAHCTQEEQIALKKECPQCGAILKDAQNLYYHIKKVHNGPKNYECLDCGAIFKKKNQLLNHRTEHHGDSTAQALRTIKCPHERCDKKFSTNAKMRIHMKVHQGYPCDETGCGLVLQNWSALRKHKSTVHAAYKCEECGDVFRMKSHLRNHQEIHIPAEDRLSFSCEEDGCGKSYSFKRNLLQHVRIAHKGETWKQRNRKKKKKREHDVIKLPGIEKAKAKSSAAAFLYLDDRGEKLTLNKGVSKEVQECFNKEMAETVKKRKTPSTHHLTEFRDEEIKTPDASDHTSSNNQNKALAKHHLKNVKEENAALRIELNISSFDTSVRSDNSVRVESEIRETETRLDNRDKSDALTKQHLQNMMEEMRFCATASNNDPEEIAEKICNIDMSCDISPKVKLNNSSSTSNVKCKKSKDIENGKYINVSEDKKDKKKKDKRKITQTFKNSMKEVKNNASSSNHVLNSTQGPVGSHQRKQHSIKCNDIVCREISESNSNISVKWQNSKGSQSKKDAEIKLTKPCSRIKALNDDLSEKDANKSVIEEDTSTFSILSGFSINEQNSCNIKYEINKLDDMRTKGVISNREKGEKGSVDIKYDINKLDYSIDCKNPTTRKAEEVNNETAMVLDDDYSEKDANKSVIEEDTSTFSMLSGSSVSEQNSCNIKYEINKLDDMHMKGVISNSGKGGKGSVDIKYEIIKLDHSIDCENPMTRKAEEVNNETAMVLDDSCLSFKGKNITKRDKDINKVSAGRNLCDAHVESTISLNSDKSILDTTGNGGCHECDDSAETMMEDAESDIPFSLKHFVKREDPLIRVPRIKYEVIDEDYDTSMSHNVYGIETEKHDDISQSGTHEEMVVESYYDSEKGSAVLSIPKHVETYFKIEDLVSEQAAQSQSTEKYFSIESQKLGHSGKEHTSHASHEYTSGVSALEDQPEEIVADLDLPAEDVGILKIENNNELINDIHCNPEMDVKSNSWVKDTVIPSNSKHVDISDLMKEQTVESQSTEEVEQSGKEYASHEYPSGISGLKNQPLEMVSEMKLSTEDFSVFKIENHNENIDDIQTCNHEMDVKSNNSWVKDSNHVNISELVKEQTVDSLSTEGYFSEKSQKVKQSFEEVTSYECPSEVYGITEQPEEMVSETEESLSAEDVFLGSLSHLLEPNQDSNDSL